MDYGAPFNGALQISWRHNILRSSPTRCVGCAPSPAVLAALQTFGLPGAAGLAALDAPRADEALLSFPDRASAAELAESEVQAPRAW